MLTIISPAKTLDFEVKDVKSPTRPEFLTEASTLASELKKYNPKQLAKLLDVSPKLAELNANRYTEWTTEEHEKSGKAAILVYKGDVYQGLQAGEFSVKELAFAQNHLRIISGLYGVLRPLDLILPYRLDMGISLKTGKKKDLYAFWKTKVTEHLAEVLNKNKTDILINLASEEYFKAIDTGKLKARVITPVFKDFKNGQFKIISFFTKKARGMMSRFIIREEVRKPSDLKLFNDDGYFFNDNLSDENTLAFTRG
jgi:uncharacterized protein